MFELKTYQSETITLLESFLTQSRLSGPQAAFESLPNEQGLGNPFRREYQPLDGLAAAPYVCLRLPTGGGKTFLAAHSVRIATETYLDCDYPLVLWLVPTNTIRSQTLDTLNNPNHPNRAVLDEAFKGRVLVLDIADFAQLRPQDLRDKVCVIVGTFATLRVESTDGRKVYAHNENLEPHFARVPETTPNMERIESGPDAGKIKFSFRNLLTLYSPLVIVDEAHNASSKLSFEVLHRINPACVIEFTATPAGNSNILHNVSAAQLKAENMIKLPIMLTQHPTWQDAITDSHLTRQKLAETARLEREFVHPIVLIQAQDRDQEVTVTVIERFLVDEMKIPRERIAIATGTQRELDDINLFDPTTNIDFIITIEALKEGWDCPFAYVFCSVASPQSKRDVEQLLGRVLRMPYAKRRTQADLNRAYAHVSSSTWPYAVNQLHDHLVEMGFDQQEADGAIQPSLPFAETAGGQVSPDALQVAYSVQPDTSAFSSQELAMLQFVATPTKQVIVQIRGTLTPELEQKLIQAAPLADRAAVEQTLTIYRRQHRASPAERGETLSVPLLCVLVDGELEPADRELFIDPRGWNLLDYPAELSEAEFRIEEKAENFLIDVYGQRLIEKYLGSQLALNLADAPTDWTELSLSRWLDPYLRKKNLRQEVLLEFIRLTIEHLITRRKISLSTLLRVRFQLRKALEWKIGEYEKRAYQAGFQATLFGPTAVVQTSYDYKFDFDPVNYPAHWFYAGRYQFEKHFYTSVGELEPSGEQFECAQAIDRSRHIKKWVRNLTHPKFSFLLPLSAANFYPDFVADLHDGRILVVEYKGAHLDAGEQEKRNIGERWEEVSDGKAMFLWALERDDKGRDVYRQLEDKITRKK